MGLTGGVLTAAAPDGVGGTVVRGLLRTADTAVRVAGGSGDGPPVTTPRDPAREAARRELSKRLYHENDPGLFQRALNAFWDWLDRLFNSAASATPGGTTGLVVVILFVVAVLGALWWRLGTPHRQPSPTTTALFDDRPRSAAEHRAAAEAGRTLPAHTERLRAAAREFDDVTYGGRRATEQAYHRIAELDRDLERARPALAHSTTSTAHTTHQGATE
ncbi:hypothetical protein ACFYZB_15580 [Streptomyces sp. NPDC001852]|uniref:hypothetical protein n=1 Tax=Streptomyces sp. NPDC001852 TaxID=3364619 RepID=UPI0036CD976F